MMRRAGIGLAVATALGLVFYAYLMPEQAMALASRVWACF